MTQFIQSLQALDREHALFLLRVFGVEITDASTSVPDASEQPIYTSSGDSLKERLGGSILSDYITSSDGTPDPLDPCTQAIYKSHTKAGLVDLAYIKIADCAMDYATGGACSLEELAQLVKDFDAACSESYSVFNECISLGCTSLTTSTGETLRCTVSDRCDPGVG